MAFNAFLSPDRQNEKAPNIDAIQMISAPATEPSVNPRAFPPAVLFRLLHRCFLPMCTFIYLLSFPSLQFDQPKVCLNLETRYE